MKRPSARSVRYSSPGFMFVVGALCLCLPVASQAQLAVDAFSLDPGVRAQCRTLDLEPNDVGDDVPWRMQFLVGVDTLAQRVADISYDSIGAPRRISIAIFEAGFRSDQEFVGVTILVDRTGKSAGLIVRARASAGSLLPPAGANPVEQLSEPDMQRAVVFARELWGARCGPARAP